MLPVHRTESFFIISNGSSYSGEFNFSTHFPPPFHLNVHCSSMYKHVQIYLQYLVTPQLHVVNGHIRRQYGWSIYVALA